MSIQISTVRISNFRGISNLEMDLPRVTVLLGPNNAGKTSIIKALQLALGDYSRFLSDEDFYINELGTKTDEITIDILIIPIQGITRTNEFSTDWLQEFGDKIQSEANGQQFVAIRTIAKPDAIKGGFTIERFTLNKWPSQTSWLNERPSSKNKITKKFSALPFFPIEAQRDIHSELKEKNSFIGKALSNINYNSDDINALEKLIHDLNTEAIDKSDSLKELKKHLDQLSQSINSSGNTELTPFPKKVRDLSKGFSIHFGESDNSSFSMEYHGMGTRSWASILTLKAFIALQKTNHEKELEPFFPIIAAEEPEAHLHPNAQRTLYNQLVDTPGQVIISTHSPYIAALSDLNNIRYLNKISKNTPKVCKIEDLDDQSDDKRKLQREVIHSRGELLFANAIVLAEGETEEQVLPYIFEKYTGKFAFELGVNFIAVHGSGAKYRPFLQLAKNFDIPVFVFSDGEENTIRELKKQFAKVFSIHDIESQKNIIILENNDFEGYLFDNNFIDIIEQAIIDIDGPDKIDKWITKREGTNTKPQKTDKPPCITCKQPIFESASRSYATTLGKQLAMQEIIDEKKPLYAAVIAEKLGELPKEKFPKKIISLFENILEGRNNNESI